MLQQPIDWSAAVRRAGVVAFSGASTASPEALRLVVWPVLARLLASAEPHTSYVTGACVGVDAYCAQYMRARGGRVHTVVPSDRSRVDPAFTANCTTFEMMPSGSSYRARNERLVAYAERLVAFPALTEMQERGRRGSGTWMTIRLARRAGLQVEIYPLHEGRG